MDNFEEDYFECLCEFIGDNPFRPDKDFSILLKHLYNTEFYYKLDKDDNRALDGEKLREKFNINIDTACNLLEMLIALAVRCDRDVMYSPAEGDRTNLWFWTMIKNLGLNSCDDWSYDHVWGIEEVDKIIDRFMNREYSRTGEGGLFPITRRVVDQRKVEIWYQMSTYLIEQYGI